MTARLNPYIGFRGEAREAMQFYERVFGGTLTVNTFGEFDAQHSPEQADRIMHSALETTRGFTIMAGDMGEGGSGADIAMCLNGDDAEELRGYWRQLSDGGTVQVPLDKQMWGDEFGACVDRFGVSWMVNIDLQQG